MAESTVWMIRNGATSDDEIFCSSRYSCTPMVVVTDLDESVGDGWYGDGVHHAMTYELVSGERRGGETIGKRREKTTRVTHSSVKRAKQ